MKSTVIILFRVLLVGALVAVAGTNVVRAQSDPVQQQGNPEQGSPEQIQLQRRPDPQRMQELLKRIEQVKLAKLKEHLGMDDKQAAQFIAIYKPSEQDIQSLVKQRNEVLLRIRQFGNGGRSGTDVDGLMQQARDITNQIQQRLIRLNADLKTTLSPQQRARLLIFEQEFNNRVRAQVLRHRFLQNHQQLRKQIQEFRKMRRLLRARRHR